MALYEMSHILSCSFYNLASLETVLIVFCIKEVERDKDLARIESVCTFKRVLHC